MESTNFLLATVSVLFNAGYVARGNRGTVAAAAGLFFGVTSLAVAGSNEAEFPAFDIAVGLLSLSLSIANLQNENTPTDGSDDTYDPPLSTAAVRPSLGVSVTF